MNTEEKIDQYDVNMYAQQVAGKAPDIPLTYLLATPISEVASGRVPRLGQRPR